MARPILLLCACTLLCISLSGCGGEKTIKQAPYEDIALTDIRGDDLSDAGAERLYQAGHEHLVAGNPNHALRIFSEIQRRYPFSPYATQAAMETATAYYLLGEYSKVVSAADQFIKQHPRHANVDYMYYLRGLANYNHNETGGLRGLITGNPDQRDLSYLKQAFEDFKLLIRNFPNSVYARDARMHMIKIRNRLADFELTVAEYYLKRGAYVAAARRAAYVVKHYQRSTATPRALEIMQEAYIKLGLPELARDARAILQASYGDYIVHRADFYHDENADSHQGNWFTRILQWMDAEARAEQAPTSNQSQPASDEAGAN